MPQPKAWMRVAPAIASLTWGGNHFTPLLILYRENPGYSAIEVDLFFAFYIVGLVPGFLFAGPVADRIGHRRVVLAGLVLGSAASVVLAGGSHAAAAMCVGRMLSGIGVAIAMVIGTTWIRELSLSTGEGDPAETVRAAQRATITVTAGLGLGAGISGVLAQWGPSPLVLPYAVHLAATIVAAALVLTVPASAPPGTVRSERRNRLPRSTRRRFLAAVVPLAPWVFTCAALAYAVTPTLVAGVTDGRPIAVATLITVVTLAAGTIVQPFLGAIERMTSGRAPVVALVLAAGGTTLCALTAAAPSVVLALFTAIVLGCGYGLCLVAGVVEVQTAIRDEHLALATGIYYCLTYVGFLLPLALAIGNGLVGWGYPAMIAGVAVLAIGCGAVLLRSTGGRRRAHPGAA